MNNYYIADGVRHELEAGQTYLDLSFKSLKTLVVVSDTLEKLYCDRNQLASLDVRGCVALKELSCSNNQLSSLDVSGCVDLKRLDCHNSQLTLLDVSGCVALERLDCDHNQLTSLDVIGCVALRLLYCDDNQLSSLDVSKCVDLELLYCDNNQLTLLDVSGCVALKRLHCYNNQLSAICVGNLRNLKTVIKDNGCEITNQQFSAGETEDLVQIKRTQLKQLYDKATCEQYKQEIINFTSKELFFTETYKIPKTLIDKAYEHGNHEQKKLIKSWDIPRSYGGLFVSGKTYDGLIAVYTGSKFEFGSYRMVLGVGVDSFLVKDCSHPITKETLTTIEKIRKDYLL